MKSTARFITGVAAIAAMAFIAIGAGSGHGANTYGKQKVVYHINYPGGEDNGAYAGALGNIQNHINAVGAKNLDLKVVIHGNGIYLLKSASKEGSLQTAVANLRSQNVSFNVCANTLKGKNIALNELYEVFDEDVVLSGVAELSHLQAQGYTYIKP